MLTNKTGRSNEMQARPVAEGNESDVTSPLIATNEHAMAGREMDSPGRGDDEGKHHSSFALISRHQCLNHESIASLQEKWEGNVKWMLKLVTFKESLVRILIESEVEGVNKTLQTNCHVN